MSPVGPPGPISHNVTGGYLYLIQGNVVDVHQSSCKLAAERMLVFVSSNDDPLIDSD